MPTVLITGANRGIGLELARQYAEAGWRVHACARKPAKASALKALAGDIRLHKLDVTNGRQIAALARALKGETLDLLVNNAGVGGTDEATDPEPWLEVFRVNSIAPVRMLEACLPHLERSKHARVLNLTSRLGSIADNSSGGSYAYRSSKAALNAAMKSLAIDLEPKRIIVILMHPGWVQTDMGGAGAPITPQTSVAGLRRVIAEVNPSDSGGFFNYDGKPIPW
jgi:NAD(P)-dependent dehydrogenase (short-subunit alcohol dehydrogenase family)